MLFFNNAWLSCQVHRLAVVVQLLLGEIPDRKTFREAHLKKTLAPYYQLTQGMLHVFSFFFLGGGGHRLWIMI